MQTTYAVDRVDWITAADQLRAVRITVFVEEQHVPEELEWDEADAAAHHVLATDSAGNPIGTGRLKPDCHIGRMAVVKSWRGRGVGGAILSALLAIAATLPCRIVRLHAQTHAIPFYARFGFTAIGEEFEEAGIPHRVMELALTVKSYPIP